MSWHFADRRFFIVSGDKSVLIKEQLEKLGAVHYLNSRFTSFVLQSLVDRGDFDVLIIDQPVQQVVYC